MEIVIGTSPVLVFDRDKGINLLYKYEIRADDYPNSTVKAIPIFKGDPIIIQSKEKVTIGQKYKEYPARISEIIYFPKKWWQFWKKKRQWGYKVMWE